MVLPYFDLLSKHGFTRIDGRNTLSFVKWITKKRQIKKTHIVIARVLNCCFTLVFEVHVLWKLAACVGVDRNAFVSTHTIHTLCVTKIARERERETVWASKRLFMRTNVYAIKWAPLYLFHFYLSFLLSTSKCTQWIWIINKHIHTQLVNISSYHFFFLCFHCARIVSFFLSLELHDSSILSCA